MAHCVLNAGRNPSGSGQECPRAASEAAGVAPIARWIGKDLRRGVRRWILFAFTADDHWRAGIGDPTILGWLTVAAYILATFFCWKAMLAARKNGRKSEAPFWFLFTCFLLLLGINKQLDLQTWFTLFGKHLAQAEGWYTHRRAFQAGFIGFITVLGVSGLILFWRLARRRVRHYRLALVGGIFLTCFVLIRAASFHYVDQMLGLRLSHVTLNCALELGGILCVASAAIKAAADSPSCACGLYALI